MKVLLEFDHDKECVLEAMGSEHSGDQANELIRETMMRYVENDKRRLSTLAERIHKELDYDIVLFIATASLADKMGAMMMKDSLRRLLEMMDDDDEGL